MKKILMVCLGNICRSPLAEELLRSKVNKENVLVDSAGLDHYHIGEPPCKSSQEIAKKHNLNISHLRARRFEISDFEKFDKIYIMDNYNWEIIQKKARNESDLEKIDFILNEIYPNENLDVPDSYQKGMNAAQIVFNMLDQATDKIAKDISNG